MKLKLYQVDAFTGCVFRGNPAAVVPLEAWLPNEMLQAIALENNLSETAYFIQKSDGPLHLRWFTPAAEVPLCGHATLASAHVLLTMLRTDWHSVKFETLSGVLTVVRRGDLLVMDFPSRPPNPCAAPAGLLEGLREPPVEILKTDQDPNFYVVYSDSDTVARIQPDLTELLRMPAGGICITAPGNDSDFVSRYFAPHFGIPEDPVTGSTHCALIPYWAGRLGKQKLFARQVSARGGELHCELMGERVAIAGSAVLYLEGEISV